MGSCFPPGERALLPERRPAWQRALELGNGSPRIGGKNSYPGFADSHGIEGLSTFGLFAVFPNITKRESI
jgi:hypothetical protein